MGKTKGSKEQKPASSVRRKAEQESILTPTFAAGRQHAIQDEPDRDRQVDSGLRQGDRSPKQAGEMAVAKSEAGMIARAKTGPAVTAAAGHDFSHIPAHTQPSSASRSLQPKLTVNAPGDRYEQEADRTAGAVMEEPQRPAFSPPRDGDSLLGPAVPVNPLTAISRSRLSRTGAGEQGAFEAAPEVERRIEHMRGGGSALPEEEQSFFESRMGYDFGQVRIHTGPEAAQTSQEIGAHAYTSGSDIAFSEGAYRPGTETGRRLMAHELTHVVQQGGAGTQRKATPDSQVKSHLAGLGDRPGFSPSLYRQEIADFREEHDPDEIHAGQRQLLPGRQKVAIRERDQSLTLRRQETGPPREPEFGVGDTPFSTGGGGKLKVNPADKWAELQSADFRPSGSVKIQEYSGPTSAEHRKDLSSWDVGFIQTMIDHKFVAHYEGSPKYTKYLSEVKGPLRDAMEYAEVPWYSEMARYTGGSVTVHLQDTPTMYPKWETPDRKGKLSRTEGTSSFAAGLIAQKRESKETIQYIKWADWEVDWGATFKYATTGDKEKDSVTGKMSILGSGDGQGKATPVPKGPLATDAVHDAFHFE